MGSSWMLRATVTSAPERFLDRGLARFVSRAVADEPQASARTAAAAHRRRSLARAPQASFAVELPRELVRLFEAGGGRALGDFVPGAGPSTKGGDALRMLLRRPLTSRASRMSHAKLVAYLAGALPFGTTRGGELWAYVLGEPSSPARGVVATLDPQVPSAPRLCFRDASTFAFACALEESAAAEQDAPLLSRIEEARARLPSPGVAEQEGVRAAFERASTLFALLTASDAVVRRTAKKLAPRPFEPPHPPVKTAPARRRTMLLRAPARRSRAWSPRRRRAIAARSRWARWSRHSSGSRLPSSTRSSSRSRRRVTRW